MYLNTCEKGKPQKETQGYRGDWGGSCVESRRAEPGPQRPGDGEPLVSGAGLWQLLLGGCPCWVHLSPLLSAAASACTALSLRHYPDDEGSLSSYPSPVCSSQASVLWVCPDARGLSGFLLVPGDTRRWRPVPQGHKTRGGLILNHSMRLPLPSISLQRGLLASNRIKTIKMNESSRQRGSG